MPVETGRTDFVGRVFDDAMMRVQRAQDYLDDTTLAAMNIVADAMVQTGPTADQDAFLAAMGDHVRYQRPDTYKRRGYYEQVAQWFGEQALGKVFAGSSEISDEPAAAAVYLIPRTLAAPGTPADDSGNTPEKSVVTYRVEREPESRLYMGTMEVGVLSIRDFQDLDPRKAKSSDLEVVEDTYIALDVVRPPGQMSSVITESDEPVFGMDLADWLTGDSRDMERYLSQLKFLKVVQNTLIRAGRDFQPQP